MVDAFIVSHSHRKTFHSKLKCNWKFTCSKLECNSNLKTLISNQSLVRMIFGIKFWMQLKSKVGSLIKLLFYILYYINGVLKENEKLTPLVLFISTIDSNESKKQLWAWKWG